MPDNFGRSKVFSYGVVCLFQLFAVGCNPVTSSGDQNASVAANAERTIVFDGQSVIRGDKTPLIQPYKIEVALKSGRDDVAVSPTEDTPPMPFLAGHFAVYQIGNSYRVLSGGEQIAVIEGTALEVQDFTFSVDENDVGSMFVGNEQYWSGEISRPVPLVIGQGFKNRYWEGEISKFKVYIGELNSTSGKMTPTQLVFDIFDQEPDAPL